MPTYVGFHALGSIISGIGNSAVHGVSLGSQALTPVSISHTIRSAEIEGFQYGVEAPRDSGSGKPIGKRPHRSITVTKETNESSPLLFQIWVNNETLPKLNLNFFTSSSRSKGRHSFTLTLTNAIVASIRHGSTHQRSQNTYELEEVELTFQKIEISNLESKTSASDDWTG